MEYTGLVASIVMGLILGTMGGGGSILTVPILVYLFALSPTVATGYSLFVVGITALIGSILFIRRGDVDFLAAGSFAFPSVIGVNISRGLVIPMIPNIVGTVGTFTLTKEILVMVVFAALMIAASYSMIRKKNERKPIQASAFVRVALIGMQGLIVGSIAGFVGAGGGFLIIPSLVFMAGLSMRVSVGTSLVIIAFQSLLGFAGDVSRGLQADWPLIVKVTAFAVMGIIAGSAFAHKIKEEKLKFAFGWFVLIMGITILAEQLRHISS